MTAAATTCDNPKCTCDPCTCNECGCGVASLGELERRVMDLLWEEPGRELAGRQVADALPVYAYTTVATVLDRLVHKGMVSRRMEGRAIQFAATGTRATHTAELMHETLVVTGDPESTLARFAETLSRSEADVLRHSLDQPKRERQRKRS
jgi:predicted transcriptional regulator